MHRAVVESAARELLRLLADLPGRPSVRVADAGGGLACLIQVWDATKLMPAAAAERRGRAAGGGRAGCQRDIVSVVAAADRPLTRKQIVRALKAAGHPHGPGTVAKALAHLTAAGGLVNPRDKRGYRLPAWRRGSDTPSLFS